MIPPTVFPVHRGLLTSAALLSLSLPSVMAQGLSLRTADDSIPGVESFLAGAPLPDFKGGIYSGIKAETTYDSNLLLSADYPTSDVYLELEPWLAYRSDPDGNARYSLELLYSPLARVFWNNSDLNSIDHAGSVSFRMRGAKTDMLGYYNYTQVSGPDRLAGGFVEGSVMTYGFKGSYQLAPKTKIKASWRASMSDFDTIGRAGTDSYLTDVGLEWDPGRRLSLGASVRHSLIESASIGERESWALLGHLGYSVTDRIDLTASLGVEFAENSRAGGGSDSGAIGKLNMTYRVDERWRWNALIRYVTVPSPGNLNYIVDDLLFSTSLTRQLNRGQIEGGIAYSISQYDTAGLAPVLTAENERNLSVFLAYSRPIFNERVDLTTMIRYTTNTGLRNWDQVLVTVGLSTEF